MEDWLWATAGRARGQWGHQHPNQCPAARAVVLQLLSHCFVCFYTMYNVTTVLVVKYSGSCNSSQTHPHSAHKSSLLNSLLMTCLCVQLEWELVMFKL